MITATQVAWAAGFLEGEGSFGYYESPRVSAAQVEKEPIDRLISIFGGHSYLKNPTGLGLKPIWTWRPDSRLSVQIMMTVYTLMSPKRKLEIERCLDKWKSARLLKKRGSDVCAMGHKLTGSNAVLVGHYRKCRICKNATRRAYRARIKSEADVA